jgi:hypothetical protein
LGKLLENAQTLFIASGQFLKEIGTPLGKVQITLIPRPYWPAVTKKKQGNEVSSHRREGRIAQQLSAKGGNFLKIKDTYKNVFLKCR